MGICASSINVDNVKEPQEKQIFRQEEDETQLNKAKKVIDDLNVEIDNLEKELISLRRQVSKEKQKKEEEADKFDRAQARINKIEMEKAELKQKMYEMSAVNGQTSTINHDTNHNTENHANLANHGKHCIFEPDYKDTFGKLQSPINIVSSTHSCTTNIMKKEEFERNPLRFNYPSKVKNCTILNTGHTVQVNIDPSNNCTLHINDSIYELKQFHFHTPSEHTIDSKQYEMEMHLVHVNSENEIAVLGFIFTTRESHKKPKLQLTKSRAHLILATESANNPSVGGTSNRLGDTLNVMQEAVDDEQSEESDMETDDEWEEKGDDKDKKGNDFLDQFWSELPGAKTDEDIVLKKAISFDYLFETSSNNFTKNVKTNEIDIDMEIFEYTGSLTTPPFTEGVQWLVSKSRHFINGKQLKKLSACWNNENNARPVQEYFGRTVSLRSKSSLRVV